MSIWWGRDDDYDPYDGHDYAEPEPDDEEYEWYLAEQEREQQLANASGRTEVDDDEIRQYQKAQAVTNMARTPDELTQTIRRVNGADAQPDQSEVARLKAQLEQLQREFQAASTNTQQPSPQRTQPQPRKPDMNDNNPLPELVNANPILSGTYNARFDRIETFEGTAYQQPDVPQTKISFIFALEEGGEITKVCNYVLSSKGRLRPTVRSLNGGQCPESVFTDRHTLWANIKSLLNRNYLLICEPNEQKTHTNIVAISPIRTQPAQRPAPVAPAPVAEAPADITFDDDDIPF